MTDEELCEISGFDPTKAIDGRPPAPSPEPPGISPQPSGGPLPSQLAG